MNRHLSSIVFLLLLLGIASYCFAWSEYENYTYLDFDGDSLDEIIVESRTVVDDNHYREDMRIFKDELPEWKLIFHAQTMDSTFRIPGKENTEVISEVKFKRPDPEDSRMYIVVKTRKIYYRDTMNKRPSKLEDVGTKIYMWDGTVFSEFSSFENEYSSFFKKLKKDSIVFFFPADKATINGYGITAREWKQFSKIQKKKFISEAVKEIETRESVSVTEKNLDKISAILDAGVKKLGEGDSSPMIGMLLQMLKASNYTKKNEG